MRSFLTIPALIATLLLAAELNAQDPPPEFNWTNATGDNSWGNEDNWNLGGDGFPGPGSDVNINGGVGRTRYFLGITTNPTTLDLGPSAQLDIESGKIGFPANSDDFPYSFQNSAEINVFEFATLEARGSSRNFSPATINLFPDGSLEVHSDGAFLNTSTQNTGNGTVNMLGGTITGSGSPLLVTSNQSILGFGNVGDNQIGLLLGASSIIDANVDGSKLTIDSGNSNGIENLGIIRASNGGILEITSAVINNSNGLIEALDDSELMLNSGFDITGGILRRVGTGVFNGIGSGTLSDLQIDGATIIVPQQQALTLHGAIENNGEIIIIEDSGGGSTRLLIADLVTLSGGGVVELQSISDGFNANIQRSGPTGSLTNIDHTIRGRGDVGRNQVLINNQTDGVINASDPDGRLTLDSLGTALNRGLFTASAGGELFLTGDIDNANGLIEPQNDSTITLSGSNVIGGTLRNVGTGGFTFASGTVTDATFDGVFTVGQQLTLFLDGAINNQGEIVVEETTGGGSTRLQIDDSVSLNGGGVVTLSSISDAFNARITDTSADGVLTNVDNTIQGRGGVGDDRVRIINETDGVLVGNDSDGLLTVGVSLANPSINRGLITAADGGNLSLVTGEWDNSDGLIEPQSLSTVTVGGTVTVEGGVLNAADDSTIELAVSGSVVEAVLQSDGSGKFEVPTGNPSIVDSTIQSDITVLQQAGLRLEGTIENEGEIVVSETSGGGSTRLLITDLVTLSGGGVVDLQSISDGFAANIDRSGATGTLSNVDNTIQGRGLVGRNRVQIANQSAGVINANDPDGRLTFDSLGTAINRGFFTASAGGELLLTGDIDNANGLIESQNDSTITLNGSANVIGGTLRNVGTGGFTFASGTVTDATFDGVFTVGQQLTLFLDGTINNQGEIVISETSGGGVAQLAIDDSVSLTGGGIVNLQSVSDAFTARITGSGGILTNVDNTIQGRGRIGFNTLQVINQALSLIHI